MTSLIGGPFSQRTIERRLAQEMSHLQEHGYQYWPIFHLDGDRHMGCAGFRPYRDDGRVCEFGIHLRPEFHGHGIASEASGAIIDYGFGALGLETVVAGHNPSNVASRNLLMKHGFLYVRDEFYPPTCLMHPFYMLER